MDKDCWKGRVNSNILRTTKHSCAVKSLLNVYSCGLQCAEIQPGIPLAHCACLYPFTFLRTEGSRLSFCASLQKDFKSWAIIFATGILSLLYKPNCTKWVGLVHFVQGCARFSLGQGVRSSGFYPLSLPPAPQVKGEGKRSSFTCICKAMGADPPVFLLLASAFCRGLQEEQIHQSQQSA